MSQQQREISYSTCNAMEKRILSRRPLNRFAVLSLKKPTLRRFLRSNGQRYKARDRKERLVQLAIHLVYKKPDTHSPQQRTRNTNVEKSHKLPRPPLGCTSEQCTCSFNYIDVMNHVDAENKKIPKLSKITWNKVFLLSHEPKKQLEQCLVESNVEFKPTNCKYNLAIQLRNKLIDDELRLKEEVIEKESETTENQHSCPTCHQNKPAEVAPCNHLICKKCHEPLQQVRQCPICKGDVTHVREAYEQTLEPMD